MVESLSRLYAFDYWANQEILRSLQAMEKVPDRAAAILAHIAAAQRLWWERVQSAPQSVKVWPSWSLKETEQQLASLRQKWQDIIGFDDMRREVAYTNTKGERFTSSVRDITTHVILHGVYHRGQIALLTRQHGGEPAYTDFIHAVRTSQV